MLGLPQILASKLTPIGNAGLEHFSEPRAIQGLKMAPMTQTPQNPLEACTTASREGPMPFEGVTVNDGVKT